MIYVQYTYITYFSSILYLRVDVMTGKEGIKIPEKRTHVDIRKYKRDQTLKWQLPSQVNFIRKHLERLLA